MIFELLHTMALIHDDIIDQADKRHNVATIHHYIANQIGKENMHIAEGQAILFGDLVLSRVYELQNKSFDIAILPKKSSDKNVFSDSNLEKEDISIKEKLLKSPNYSHKFLILPICLILFQNLNL